MCSAPHILVRDFETWSALDLSDTGAWRYAADPTTDILCISYAADDAPVQIWTPGQPIPEEFLEAARNSDWLVVAHNDQFESAIEQRLLGPRYSWPQIPLEQHRCTMAMALAAAMPAALENAAAVLALPFQKDRDGQRLMRKLARRTDKDPDPEDLKWLYEYCRRDSEIERALFHRLPPLSPAEQVLWELDQRINARGFHVDRALAEAAHKLTIEEQKAVNRAVAVLTDGKITTANQVLRIRTFVEDHGHQLKSLAKRNVAAVLAHNPEDDVKQLLELRRDGSRAAARKLDTLLASINADDRVRGTLRYHGAATGRWSGNGFQPQNLKKSETKELDAAIDAILAEDIERVRTLGAPLSIVGDVSRSMICAAPGHMLIGADFSAIESRVLAWIAGETWKANTYQQYDATQDSSLEPYCVTASRILRRPVTPEDEAGRAIGKTCDLAFGYAGGLGAWRKFDNSDTYTDAKVEKFKEDWRAAHRATVRFWHALESGLIKALRTKQHTTLNNLTFEFDSGTLYLTLPSGRGLAYPEAQLGPGKFAGTTQINFKDNAKGSWREVRGWCGSFTENVVQAVSRDLLAEAMKRLEAAGYPIVLHVHDEIVCEVQEGFDNTTHFLALMTTLPEWAPGLPIAAKVWTGKRYAKTKPSAATPISSSEGDEGNLPPHPHSGHSGITHQQPAYEVEDAAPTTLDMEIRATAPTKLNGHASTLILPEPAAIAIPPEADCLEERLKRIPLPALIGEPLIDGKVRCPFHDDSTPSCQIYDDHYHCFGCGARGNHLDWLRNAEGLSDDAAFEALLNWQGRIASPRQNTDAAAKLKRALELWDEANPIAGTLAIRYLADVRRIDTDQLPAGDTVLRFHRHCPFGPGVYVPCLLALFRDVETDEAAGIHRIALTPDVFTGGKVQRKMFGTGSRPSAIKLWPVTEQLFIGEGIETVLAAATRLPYHGAPMQPAWAAGSSNGIRKIPAVPGVEQLRILVDHDTHGISQAAAAHCTERWSRAGRTVIRLMPTKPGTDFNDVIMMEKAT